MSDFSLTEVFSQFGADRNELIEVDIDDIDECLNNLIDELAVSPDSIGQEDHFQSTMYLLNSFIDLDAKSREKLLDLILTGLQHQGKNVGSVEPGDDALPEFKSLLERYSFLLHWYLVELETHSIKNQAAVVHTSSGKSKPKTTKEFTDASQQVTQALDVACAILKLNLSGIFVTSSERDQFTGLFLKPVYLFMESEQLMKVTSAKMYLFKTICLAVKLHQQQSNVHTSLMQMLIYFEHLPEALAELLQILYEQFDHTSITEEVLKELSTKSFNTNDTKGPKFISMFINKLSQLIPQVMMRQMTTMVRLLESDSFTLRCAIIEATGNIIFTLAKQLPEDDDIERAKAQLFGMLDLIEERVLDMNPYARARALQVLTGVSELEVKFNNRRYSMTKIAVQCLHDRSIIVRRNSIKLLSRMVSTHPFGALHDSQLNVKDWQERLDYTDEELNAILPSESDAKAGNETLAEDQMELDQPSDNDEEEEEKENQQPEAEDTEKVGENAAKIEELKLKRRYYSDAIEFIEKVHEGLGQIEMLLFSKNKNEIIDCMDFLVLTDAYGIEMARSGIRKMIHLIWAKANNDEGQAIQSHLITCYQQLFFDTPIDISENDGNLLIARNLISLTYSATVAELASLEHLLVLAMQKERLIFPGVVKMLWKIYGYQQREISKSQRRGAIIILGMLAKAEATIANTGIELLLKIGLGELGRKDLGLAKYTCIALQRCIGAEEWKRAGGPATQFSKESEVVENLCSILLMPWCGMEWFGVAEQAIEAINDLCDSPDVVFTRLIQVKAAEVFNQDDDFESEAKQNSFAQLMFIVGDVALKIMVHLERCEAMFKRSKIAIEKANAGKREEDADKEGQHKRSKGGGSGGGGGGGGGAGGGEEEEDGEDGDDLEMVGGGGTTEDDFTEACTFIREKELLYGERSLLAKFGPMVSDICKQGLRNSKSHHEAVNVASTLCLSKFMCISGTYCEDNLAILMTLLERSPNSIIRSNCVLALGDIAVLFNHILDDNTDFLYRRLHDRYPVVQRTCLMTLTFLILAGQVKVKGQLGEMAKCLQDPDPRIADLSRMFFTELSTKDNAIYNGFIDMFSVLSTDRNLKQEDFHKILKFLSSFIDKDRQVKNLADKLHQRLAKCHDNAKLWNDIAYVLNLLPHKNEEIQKTVSEGFKHVPTKVDT